MSKRTYSLTRSQTEMPSKIRVLDNSIFCEEKNLNSKYKRLDISKSLPNNSFASHQTKKINSKIVSDFGGEIVIQNSTSTAKKKVKIF